MNRDLHDARSRRDWLRDAARALALTGIGVAAVVLASNRRPCRNLSSDAARRLCAGCAVLADCRRPAALLVKGTLPGGAP
ncbi:MAG: hypothetical protein ABSC03_16465 [Verrucomicrobiota bacterium]|jgi:hypothetical protein